MPLYKNVCKRCGKEMEILRSFADSEDTPKDTDPGYEPCTPQGEDCKDGEHGEAQHEWVKELGVFRLTRGSNWSGRKGYWNKQE